LRPNNKSLLSEGAGHLVLLLLGQILLWLLLGG